MGFTQGVGITKHFSLIKPITGAEKVILGPANN
jgi:hypothetical protein